ncbi:MAG: response regulator [Planctomycetota bacterium]
MSRRMLIVEDEETIAWALREIFMQDGWEVHHARDGDEAADLTAQNTYHYMITDLKLPGRPGIDLVREARAANPRLGVTVLTGYAALETAVEALRLGAWDYVTKPCRAPQLKERIEEFLSRDQAAAAARRAAGRLTEEELAAFTRGSGTEVLPPADLDSQGEDGEVFARLHRLFEDLGFSPERCARLVQSCVEAAAVLPACDGGLRSKAGLLKGHVLVGLTACCELGEVSGEMLETLSERFNVDARFVPDDGRCSVVLAEVI